MSYNRSEATDSTNAITFMLSFPMRSIFDDAFQIAFSIAPHAQWSLVARYRDAFRMYI